MNTFNLYSDNLNIMLTKIGNFRQSLYFPYLSQRTSSRKKSNFTSILKKLKVLLSKNSKFNKELKNDYL